MSKKLLEIANYSTERVSIESLTLNNYVTTDNLKQEKKGIEVAKSLPPGGGSAVKFSEGDILVSNIRPYLKKIWFADIEGGCSSDVLAIKVESTYDQKFIYYSLFRDDFFNHMMKGSKGTKMPRGDKNQILEFTVPDFNIENQIQIAKVLSDLDYKIELNNKINSDLESMAKLIYDYWFVQFDFPDESGKPYKSSGGKMIFNEELKREIPEGWKVASLLEVANFTNGIACQKYRPNDGEESYNVIKIKEMTNGFTIKSELVSRSIPEKVIVNDGDILFSWSATLDVMIWSGGIGGLNQHIFKVTSEIYPRTFFYFEVLKYLEYFKMIANSRKTTMGHITRDHLKESRVCIPPDFLIEKLHNKVDPLINKIVKANQENNKLAELRDWLLPMLMNGQVTVN